MRYVMDGSFLTGCALIDTQHGQLFEAINSLMEACESGSDEEGLKKNLSFLSDYTVKHFFDEEQLLKKHGFSDLEKHRQLHEAFKKVVRDLSHEFIFKGASENLINEIEKKIGAWLIEHIKGQDFRWAKELKEKAPELFTADGVRETSMLPELMGPSAPAALKKAEKTSGDTGAAKAAPKKAAPAEAAPVKAAAAKGKARSGSLLARMTILSSLPVFAAVLVMAVLSVKVPGGSASGRLMLTLGLAALALLAAGALLNFIFIKILVISPMKEITGVLQKVMDGDITQQIRLRSGNEIGEMADRFDQTLDKLKRLVVTIQNESETVEEIGKDLSISMAGTSGSMREINGGIQHMQRQVSLQADSVAATNAAVQRISGNIEKLIAEIETQTESVSQSSSAIEKMLANIDSVTRISRINSENVTNLAEASEVGRNGLQAVAADIQEVAKESEGLLEINAVLQNIASQTNLLSMNAAIEAAHAGESGRGFAVVADEIRKLAESSGEQSKTISTVLKKIRNAMANISASTGEVLDRFEAIDRGVKTVADQETQIRGAMEEQSAGSRQILESIQKLNEITRIVKSSSEEMKYESGEIIAEGENLRSATAEITDGMNEMAGRAGEVNDSVTHVNSISVKNKSNIEMLRKAISDFVLQDRHYLWEDSLNIGIEKIDEQHRQLFVALNSLIDAIEIGKGTEELKKALDFLINYTATHFADEEKIQMQYGFPDFEIHRRVHEEFKAEVIKMAGQLDKLGSSAATVKEVRQKVGKWLINHIKNHDSKIGIFIKEKGKPAGAP
ncbi:MAG: bacteriohemerythrin [Treponema sp.]|jgi:hemerythrin-like metal-binding protein|nr:bacteriohemerythrin [Treponema sp.]